MSSLSLSESRSVGTAGLAICPSGHLQRYQLKGFHVVVNSSFPLLPNSYAYPCLAVDSQSIPAIPAGLFHETSSGTWCATLWDGGRRPLIRFDSLLGMQIALASSASSSPFFSPSSLAPLPTPMPGKGESTEYDATWNPNSLNLLAEFFL